MATETATVKQRITSVAEDVVNGNSHALLIGMENSETLEKNLAVLKRLNVELSYDPEIPRKLKIFRRPSSRNDGGVLGPPLENNPEIPPVIES